MPEPAATARRKPQVRLDLTQGPIARTMLMFSLPVLGTSALQSLNGSINAIWVGRLLGPEALAATTNATLILLFLLGVMFGVGMAATILVGQAVGAKDLARAKQVVGTGAVFFLAFSLAMAIGGFLAVGANTALDGHAGGGATASGRLSARDFPHHAVHVLLRVHDHGAARRGRRANAVLLHDAGDVCSTSCSTRF